MGFGNCCRVQDLLGCLESRALLRKEKQECGRSATAVPPTGNPICLEHNSAPIAKAFALLSGGKHCLTGLHSPWVNTQSPRDTAHSPLPSPWITPGRLKVCPHLGFTHRGKLGRRLSFSPHIWFGTCSRHLAKPQGDGGLTGSTTLKMLVAFPSRTQLDYHPQDLVYFTAAHRNAVGRQKGIQSSY